MLPAHHFFSIDLLFVSQMDANEFLNLLFDKMEQEMKGGPQEKLLPNIIGGRVFL